MKHLEHYWQTRNGVAWALLPLSWLYCVAVALRRVAYRNRLLVSHNLPVSVIVVGNISVGGTGKTPLVIWLVRHLKTLGYTPGIVTRGYGGASSRWPRVVQQDSDPGEVGDEAVLLARNGDCPVVAGPERVENGRILVEEYHCDLIVSDDGLQHYALNRDLEIAVIDGGRRFGNGFCLPAGPLRELPARLRRADLVVTNGSASTHELWIQLRAEHAVNLRDPLLVKPLEAFRGERIIALAGIGNPSRFFGMLRGFGLNIEERPFPDHHGFRPRDLSGFGETPVLMTEKDAVKCEGFAGGNCWYVPVETCTHPAFMHRLNRLLTGLRDNG